MKHKADVESRLGARRVKPETLAKEAMRNPALVPEILKGISSPIPRVKFDCAKTLSILSDRRPEMLYPEFEFFAGLLDSDNKIIKWNAIDVLANLTRVDDKERFEKLFSKYYGFLTDDVMISAAHVIDNSGRIARAKPQLAGKITDELLKAEGTERKPECRNILLGKAISAFQDYFDLIEKRDEVMSLARRQLSNTRNATKMKAQDFLKTIEGRKAG